MKDEIKQEVLKELKIDKLAWSCANKYSKNDYENFEIIIELSIQKTAEAILGLGGLDTLQIWDEPYKKVLEHRQKCKSWGKEFCLKCFGGGLTKFTNALRNELINKWVKK